MTDVSLPLGPGRAISQHRSRKTYEALIATGFRLLEQQEFESITIADIAREAGYSVGAFYARFQSKDEYFEAMVAQHLQERADARRKLFDTAPANALPETIIKNIVDYYWRQRRFWRAALMRSTNDPAFWEPINQSGEDFLELLTARIQNDSGRALTAVERKNVGFATHMVLSVLNNRIVNRPHPSLIDHENFVADLVRAFRLVSDYDRITSSVPTATAST